MTGEIYICCSKSQPDQLLLGEIRKFLSPLGAGGSQVWHRGDVVTGELIEAMRPALQRANCALLLVSQDLLNDREVFELELDLLDAFRRRGGPVFWIALRQSTIAQAEDTSLPGSVSQRFLGQRSQGEQRLDALLSGGRRIWPDAFLAELGPSGRQGLLAKLSRELDALVKLPPRPDLSDPPGPMAAEPIEVERPRPAATSSADDLRNLPAYVDRQPQDLLFRRVLARSAFRPGANIVIVPSLEIDAPKLLVSRLRFQVQKQNSAAARFGALQSKRVEWLWNLDVEADDPDQFAQLVDMTLSIFNPRPELEQVLDSAAPLAETFRRRNVLIWTTVGGVDEPTEAQLGFLARYIRWWMTLPLSEDVYPVVLIFLEHSETKLPRSGFGSEDARYQFVQSKSPWGPGCLSTFVKPERPVALDPLSAVTAEDLDDWAIFVDEHNLCNLSNVYRDVRSFIKPGQSKPLRDVELRFLNHWFDKIRQSPGNSTR